MNYKVTILGKSYDLPARTLAVDEQIEAIGALDDEYKAKRMTRREMAEKMHAFVESFAQGALPPVDEVDTNDLFVCCENIIETYNAPLRKDKNDLEMAKVREVLNRPEVQKLFAAIPALSAISKK